MRRVVVTAAGPVVSVLLALAVTALFLTVGGYSASSAFSVMWSYGTQPSSLVASLDSAVPLYLAAVAGAFAVRMGLFNIGVDGQYRMAALAGAVAAASLPFPLAVRLPLTLLISCAVGAGWALIPALLKIHRGVNEVITSILLNAVATTVVAVLLSGVFRSGGGQNTGTAMIDAGGLMPALPGTGSGQGAVSSFVVVAVLVGVVYHLVVDRSLFGYGLRVAARSPEAAESAGIRVDRKIVQAMLVSGAVAGLVGLPHVLSVAGRFDGTLPTDLMFTGLAATLLGRQHPVGMALGAFVLAFVERSSQVLGLVQLPTEVGQVFLAVVLLSSAVGYWLTERVDQRVALAAAVRRRLRAARTPDAAPTGGAS
ncbi:ABC transporter permease [Frigoribacterium endophyticum]|uniref:ABC transporter permease n=1 Tax=Frigoribacterium endophyticum TaxID=1522176 RepID=UPI001420397F|nr:ABC transporter permease [Frigoribacterium endophyticum]NII50972.1 simple sugar transport system permease protein [Frigoribacterium endophyticum]